MLATYILCCLVCHASLQELQRRLSVQIAAADKKPPPPRPPAAALGVGGDSSGQQQQQQPGDDAAAAAAAAGPLKITFVDALPLQVCVHCVIETWWALLRVGSGDLRLRCAQLCASLTQHQDSHVQCTLPHPCLCPLHKQDLFELIEQHFAARAAITSIDSALEQQEVTFRSIQKRLLVRYKVRHPLNTACASSRRK